MSANHAPKPPETDGTANPISCALSPRGPESERKLSANTYEGTTSGRLTSVAHNRLRRNVVLVTSQAAVTPHIDAETVTAVAKTIERTSNHKVVVESRARQALSDAPATRAARKTIGRSAGRTTTPPAIHSHAGAPRLRSAARLGESSTGSISAVIL